MCWATRSQTNGFNEGLVTLKTFPFINNCLFDIKQIYIAMLIIINSMTG